MSLKGVSFWEEHVEKFALGVVGAVLVGALGMQFVLQPNHVQVGRGPKLAPQNAFNPARQAAEALKQKLESPSPALPQPQNIGAIADFRGRLAAPVSPAPRLAPLALGLDLGGTVGARIDTEAVYALPVIPAPGDIVARSFWSTIDPLEVVRRPELASVLPAEQPFDKAAVSVQGAFDSGTLLEALRADPDGDAGPARALQLAWIRDVEVLGVQLQRERLLDDGQWGEPLIIAGMPGRPDPVSAYLQNVKSASDASFQVAQIRAAHDESLRPAFYQIIAGPEWVEPVVAAETDLGQAPLAANLSPAARRLAEIDRRLARLLKNREELERRPASQPGPRGGDGGGLAPGGKGGGGGGGGGGRSQPAADPNDKRRADLDRMIKRAQDDRAKAQAELDAERSPDKPPAATLAGARPAAPQEVTMWAHDLGAAPGAEYRYRMRVVVNNPLFGQQRALSERQADLAREAVVYGEWSAWTEAVPVDRDAVYFITSASPKDQLRGARAVAETYKFYYGYYRKATTTLEPGDQIEGAAKLPKDLLLYDLKKIAEAGDEFAALLRTTGAPPTPGAPGAPGTPGAPSRGREDREQPVPTRGGGGAILDDPGAAPPPSERGATPGAPGAVDPLAAKLAEFGSPAPAELPFVVDVLMLDVVQAATSPGGAGIGGTARELPTQVVLRDTTGLLQIRMPELDRGSDLFKRVEASSKLGETQGRPVVQAPKPERPKPTPQEPPREAPRPSPGGGGGGGSGG